YMARENYIPEQDYKTSFLQVETAANRAADLCRQMLTYAGKSQRILTRIDLRPLVDEVVKMLQSAINKNVSIELELATDVPNIIGDTGQIQQIIMNLIINAAEAIGDLNGFIRVKLTKILVTADHVEKDTFGGVIMGGYYFCLEVSDTGCGMDEETKKRIFEPFYTTKFTGRGLGMSAIHGIVKSHDGFLQLTSEPGAGTTFKVYFPAPAAAGEFGAVQNATACSKKVSGTILLVEDEETLRNMGIILLEAMGFSAVTAQNGREALEIYRERFSEINLILLDLIMPVMGGIETYHELRKLTPSLPILISSGYSVESVEGIINNDEYAGFVHKPYKPEELRAVMVKMMGKRAD
ncbi:MAG: ATP-binding protein, partial [Deltaproteobacteria bacterium]